MAGWMQWDHWLASQGLRAVDWEPAAEYVRLDEWMAEFFSYWQETGLRDPRLELPEYAPLGAVLDATDQLRAAWQADPYRSHTSPGPRKVLLGSRELAELVHGVIVATRNPKEVAEILGVNVFGVGEAFKAHDLLPPLRPGARV